MVAHQMREQAIKRQLERACTQSCESTQAELEDATRRGSRRRWRELRSGRQGQVATQEPSRADADAPTRQG